jgi:hypothetical protein
MNNTAASSGEFNPEEINSRKPPGDQVACGETIS